MFRPVLYVVQGNLATVVGGKWSCRVPRSKPGLGHDCLYFNASFILAIIYNAIV